MSFNQIIMYIMAFGVVLGGTDRILGNRFGFGEKFENGFKMLGPVALSMAGIITLAPLLSAFLGPVIRPVCSLLHMDPGILGSILAIDMGGYPLAVELAADPAFGRFAGIVGASVFGCTIVFTIPVGLAAIGPEDLPGFTKGILLGFVALPVCICVAALMLGMPLVRTLWNCMPILVISALLSVGVIRKPDLMVRGFQGFARIIRGIATFGLMLAAVTHLTGLEILPGLPPLQQAMQTVSAICIVMLGSTPLAELIQRLMKVPFAWIRQKTGLNGASTTAMLLGLVSATPALAMIPDMDRRGKVVISAFLVPALVCFGAHMAFTIGTEPEMVKALIACKLAGGVLSGGVALFATRNMK